MSNCPETDLYFINDDHFGEGFKNLPDNAYVKFIDRYDDNALAIAQYKGRQVEDDTGVLTCGPERWLPIADTDVMNEEEFLYWFKSCVPIAESFPRIRRFIAIAMPLSEPIQTCLKEFGFIHFVSKPNGFEASR